MLVDSHAHLDDSRFDDDRDELICDLKKNDIDMVLNPGADMASSIKAVSLAQKYDFIYAAVGYHPHDSKDMTEETLDVLKSLTKKDKVVAIGEIGLDYHYDNSPRDIQKKWFREQIRLAKELNLPYIVHDRDAHDDILNIMKEESYDGMTGILHCFSGSVELAKEFIKMGFYISLGGPVTFKNSKKSKLVAKEIPLQHLLIETDSPYLTPVPHRGKRNEPTYVRYVAAEIAAIKGILCKDVATKTGENFKKLFKIK